MGVAEIVSTVNASAPDKVHHLHAHHHFTFLIQHFDERADDTAVGAGFGAAGFQDRGAHREGVAGEDRFVPAQFVATGGTEIGHAGKIILGIDPHHQRGGVPAAGDDVAVDAFLRGHFVGVVGQRYEAPAEVQNLLLVDGNGAEFVDRSRNIIFEIAIVGWMLKVCAAHGLSNYRRSFLAEAPCQRCCMIRAIFPAISAAPRISLMIAAESAPACQTWLNVLFVDAADGDDWNCHSRADFFEHVDAPGAVAGVFGLGAEHGAEADVVGAVALRLPRLLDVVGGDADDFVAQQFASGVERQVVLSEVHAVGVACHGDIGAVVDDQTAVVRFGFAANKLSQCQEIVGGEGFGAQLEHFYAGAQQIAQDFFDGAAFDLFRIEDGVERRERERHRASRVLS